MTPKENYLRMINWEIPEFLPAGFIDPHNMPIKEELLTPQAAPDGPIITSIGVKYIGSADLNFGAMPEPGWIVIDDITKWRDQLKIRDVSGRDWESYYKNALKDIDREKVCVSVGGGDYFLTLVSLMGFEGALMAMHEEPEEVVALLDHISEFYLMVMKQQLYWVKPDIFGMMDDDSATHTPFFSLEMYRQLFKPFQKRHCDLALEAGCIIDRHDCGKSEQFIDDWLELGVRAWNPVQTSNDCKAIKKKYLGRLALAGCWDIQGPLGDKNVDDNLLKDALAEYVDTFAPGGGFSFTAGISGAMDDPVANQKREVVKAFYYDYARDWYKRH
jgi:hypothetical protein